MQQENYMKVQQSFFVRIIIFLIQVRNHYFLYQVDFYNDSYTNIHSN